MDINILNNPILNNIQQQIKNRVILTKFRKYIETLENDDSDYNYNDANDLIAKINCWIQQFKSIYKPNNSHCFDCLEYLSNNFNYSLNNNNSNICKDFWKKLFSFTNNNNDVLDIFTNFIQSIMI